MKAKLLFVTLIMAAVPLAGQAQQGSTPKATKAQAERVAKMIKGDAAKTAAYCEIIKLSEEADEAEENKDSKKANALNAKMDELGKKLGSEYAALVRGMAALEPSSKPAQEVGAVIVGLVKLCKR